MTKSKTLTIAFLCLFDISAEAQDVNVIGMDPNQYVFWITVNADIKISKETHKEVYVVRSARKKPKGGKHVAYEKFLYRSVLGGRQLPIGPFLEYDDAKRAAGMYDLAKHTSQTMEKEIQNFKDSTAGSEYYWFFLKFSINKRTKKFELERTAARVAYGSLKDFKQVLWEGTFFKQLAIGPFPTQVEAEEAKRLYRLEED
jgi:hypothetical protein